MLLRELIPSDRQEFLAMAKEFYSGPGVLHSIPDEHFNATFELSLKGSPFLKSYLIEAEGEAVGYLLCSFTYSNEAGGMVALLEELYLRPSCRGKGYGSEVIRQIVDLFPEVRRFRLEVTHQNEGAIRLYEKLGFEPFDYLQMVMERK